jgi:heme/copper-type cytochrome/quinol oxidase subunit 2
MELAQPDPGLLIFMAAISLLVISIATTIAILFLLNLSKTLKEVSPHLRQMKPGQVWLYLIPLFGIVWIFIMVARIADSVAAEYHNRQIPCPEKRPGYGVGLAMAILGVCSILRNAGKIGEITLLYQIGLLLTVAYIIVLIIYWIKMAGYKNELRRSGHWQQYAHMSAYSQTQQTWGNEQQPDLWLQPGQHLNEQPLQPNTPPPSSPPPPTDPNDYSRFMPPGS